MLNLSETYSYQQDKIDGKPVFCVPGMLNRSLRKIQAFSDTYTLSYDEVLTENLEEAKVVTSELRNSKYHAPVIDIDIPATLTSIEPGHQQLYIAVPMSKSDIKRLIKAFQRAGITQRNDNSLTDTNFYTEYNSGKYQSAIINIDVPATLVPSSTAGHNHLYLDVPMTKQEMFRMIKTLYRVGIVEEGFYKLSKERGYVAVRLPWIKK